MNIPVGSAFSSIFNIVQAVAAALTIGVFSPVCIAQNALPPTHQKAPELELSQLLQAPAGMKFSSSSLRGKAVVLEFWATWCGPCVSAIPHLNELVETFRKKPVVFLSVTDEDRDVVQAFLERRKMDGWVGLDKNAATFQKYGIQGRPQTLLIDANGILQAATSPDRLDAKLIDRLIAGQPIDSPDLNKPVIVPMEFTKGVPPPLLQVLIRPAATVAASGFSPGAVANTGDGRRQYYGVTLRTLLAYAEKIRTDRILAPEWFDQNRYDLSTLVPRGRDELRDSLMRQMLAATFEMKSRRETEPVEVYVLSNASRNSGQLHVSDHKPSAGFVSRAGQFTGSGTSVSRLVNVLSHQLGGVEVIDETGLTGRYDFDLSWKSGDLSSLTAALHDQLGLILARDTRQLEVLVVTTATEPRTW